MYGTTGPESGTANINLNGQTVVNKLNLTVSSIAIFLNLNAT
jgi:hypothetical protein